MLIAMWTPCGSLLDPLSILYSPNNAQPGIGHLDTLSPEDRSRRMALVRGANTKPELAVRRLTFGMGFRYRLHGKGLPGRPDLVFPGRRCVILVHGCFWHRHARCKLARLPKSRVQFWRTKLEGNRERDRRNQRALRRRGWRVLVLWECQLRDVAKLGARIQRFLDN
jgi:DNA mismatch endonuclease (patch repair protein)